MQKISLFVAALILVFSADTYADVLYLKSGQTAEGRIVEEAEDYYKMEINGMTFTYYEDEVERVEKGAVDKAGLGAPPEVIGSEAPDAVSGVPSEVDPGVVSEALSGGYSDLTAEHVSGSPKETYEKYHKALHAGDRSFFDHVVEENIPPPEEMEQMMAMIGFVQAMTPKEYEMIGEKIEGNTATLTLKGTTMMGDSTGTIDFVVEDGVWKLKEENWSAGDGAAMNQDDMMMARDRPAGSGSISGKVQMPPGIREEGKLYFKLTPFGPGMSLQGIDPTIVLAPEDITSKEVPYRYDDLPLGEYFVVAVWDLAEPYCESNKACPGFNGDYTGGSQVVNIRVPGEEVTADISFMNLVE